MRHQTMKPSLIYSRSWIYELGMAALYGRHYAGRYAAVARIIPAGASVLDLCCGPAVLYRRYLRKKVVRYTGLDANGRFIRRLVREGGEGLIANLDQMDRLPRADFVVMQASLYHFFPSAARIIDMMLAAALQAVIVAEPIQNLSTSASPLIAGIARLLGDTADRSAPLRFTEATLDALFEAYRGRLSRTFFIPGGREKVYVLISGESSARCGPARSASKEGGAA